MTDHADAAMRRITTVLAAIAERIEEEVAQLLLTLDTTDGVLEETARNAKQVRDIRRQVLKRAHAEGVTSVVAALSDELPDVVERVLREYQLPPERYAADIANDLVRVLEHQVDEVAKVIGKGSADSVALAMRHAMTGALDVVKLQSNLATAMETTFGRAAVALERAVREVSDRALVEAGERANENADDPFVYVYTGPDDDVIRPYCDARVGRYLTGEQARDLDPTERYRCRHVPAPTPLSEARAQGIKPFRG